MQYSHCRQDTCELPWTTKLLSICYLHNVATLDWSVVCLTLTNAHLAWQCFVQYVVQCKGHGSVGCNTLKTQERTNLCIIMRTCVATIVSGSVMMQWHGNTSHVAGPCEGNHRSLVDSPHKRTVTLRFVLLDACLNKEWNKHWSFWCFVTPWQSCENVILWDLGNHFE